MLADIETYSTIVRIVIGKRFHSIPAGVADTGPYSVGVQTTASLRSALYLAAVGDADSGPYSESVPITVGMQSAQYHANNAIGIGDTRPNVGLIRAFYERSNGTGRGSRYRVNIADNGNGLSSDCLQIAVYLLGRCNHPK